MKEGAIMLLVVSRSEALRDAAARAEVVTFWVSEEAALQEALERMPSGVLVDLNLEPAEFSIAAIERSKQSSLPVVAFLGRPAGRQAILANLAGADRVISQEQLIEELPTLELVDRPDPG